MAASNVTISYQRLGTRPPMFVAGSFTEPLWVAQELDQRDVDGEYIFSKAFEVKPGTYQYKFRVGYSDWWICDEANETGKPRLFVECPCSKAFKQEKSYVARTLITTSAEHLMPLRRSEADNQHRDRPSWQCQQCLDRERASFRVFQRPCIMCARH